MPEFTKFQGGRMTNESFEKFKQSLSKESDRGCMLIAGAALDNSLLECLKIYFVQDSKVQANLLANTFPLGTFSSRIDASYLLGIIKKKVHRELHIIRKIRNDAGHIADNVTFAAPSISDRCQLLTPHMEVGDLLEKLPVELRHGMKSRMHFTGCSSYILGYLEGWKEQAPKIGHLPGNLGSRVADDPK